METVDPRDSALVAELFPQKDDEIEAAAASLALRLAAYLTNLRFLDALARQTALRMARGACLHAVGAGEFTAVVIRDFRYLAVTTESGCRDLKTGVALDEMPRGACNIMLDLLELAGSGGETA